MKVAIIDSGFDLSNTIFDGLNYKGYCVENECEILEGKIEDSIGHGTAVASIIISNVKNCEFIFYKTIKNKEQSYLVNDLIAVLEHILVNENQIKVIHISSGCTCCTHEELIRLKKVCDKLVEKKAVIISAYDNEGAISYPAYFESVIGVDWSLNVTNPAEYIYIKNSPINILGIGNEVRVPWIGNMFRYVSGSSFAAPYITVKVINAMQNGLEGFENTLKFLEQNSEKIIECQKNEKPQKPFEIKKAIVFPVNKEIHSILGYMDLLNFECAGIYDSKYSRNVGKRIDEVLNYVKPNECIIKSYEKINWNDDFDTVIIGHTRYLSLLLGKKVKEEMLKECLIYKKNVYCFDDDEINLEIIDSFKKENLKLFYHEYNSMHVMRNKRGKLFKFSVPSLVVLGTSSKQGKYSLQLELVKFFRNEGYHVGHFATEPTGYLFGSNVTFPIGFESMVKLKGEEVIDMANSLMHDIEEEDPELIIIGTQSHTIPNNEGNLGHYPMSTLEILLATQPDAGILCINYNDSISYIQNTIRFIESYFKTKIIGVCISPIIKQRVFSIQGNQLVNISLEDKMTQKEKLEAQLKKKVFLLGEKKEITKITEEIFCFFS